ncbi:MAG: lipocalin family protein [Phycisphaerales bacterium JB063]
MTKRTLMWMMMALIAVVPASLASADAEALHGRWSLSSVTVQGQTEEAPEGELVLEFNADGTMKMLQQGEQVESGRYTVANGQITVTTDSDGQTESADYTLDGDTFVLKMEIQPGVTMDMTFSRMANEGNYAPATNALALDASDLHGRWDLTRMEAQGQGQDVPAGSLVIEFAADGTVKIFEEGTESDSGTYSVTGNQITFTTEDETEVPVMTYAIENSTLRLSMEVQPGMVMTMILNREN